jgi:hypothetical protein
MYPLTRDHPIGETTRFHSMSTTPAPFEAIMPVWQTSAPREPR